MVCVRDHGAMTGHGGLQAELLRRRRSMAVAGAIMLDDSGKTAPTSGAARRLEPGPYRCTAIRKH